MPDVLPPAEALGRVHFVGIGGAGLSAIARIMLARGIVVSGSDGADSPTLAALRDLGATVHVGHDAAHVRDVDTIVVSTAVPEDNPEVVEARRRGLRLLPRSAGQAAVMAGRLVLAVAGTHGKTTTTSLLTVALQAAGADPSYTIGGDLAQTGANAADGRDDLFVVEADESDGAFLVYQPFAAIVTNVQADHLDVWGSEAAYAAAFDDFADRIDPAGLLVVCLDDRGAARLAESARARGRRVVTVGETAGADYRLGGVSAQGTTTSATVHGPRGELGTLSLQIPGRHYLLDAGAALALALELGFDFESLAVGVAGFTGTGRRMEAKGRADGVRVYDSYAHHPAEIAADLEAARLVAGAGRVVVVFQPHLVSRTRVFGASMGTALAAADDVVVLDVYLAREDPDPTVSGRLVADAVPLPSSRVAYRTGLDEAATEAVSRARPGDLVLTLGAGDVTRVGPMVLDLLARRSTVGGVS